ASSSRSNRVSSLLEREHRDLEAFALFAQAIRCRHARVLKRKIARVAGANAQLAVNCSGSETLHAALYDETGHSRMIAFATLLFIAPTKEKKVVGRVCQADPHLFAIQNILIAFASRR